MVKRDAEDILALFRNTYNQSEQTPSDTPKTGYSQTGYSQRSYKHQNITSDRYASFLEKYSNLEVHIDEFTTSDLMYFFREKAREFGFKYVISNMKRDMGIFKKLQENYSIVEICLMVEFIFASNQNYLDKSITQPTVLASKYCNTLYHDAMLWVDDKYVPDSRFDYKKVEREWAGDTTKTVAKVGEWE